MSEIKTRAEAREASIEKWEFKFGDIEVKIPKEGADKHWEMTKKIIDHFFDPARARAQ